MCTSINYLTVLLHCSDFLVPFWYLLSNFIVHPFANAWARTVTHRLTTFLSSSWVEEPSIMNSNSKVMILYLLVIYRINSVGLICCTHPLQYPYKKLVFELHLLMFGGLLYRFNNFIGTNLAMYLTALLSHMVSGANRFLWVQRCFIALALFSISF